MIRVNTLSLRHKRELCSRVECEECSSTPHECPKDYWQGVVQEFLIDSSKVMGDERRKFCDLVECRTGKRRCPLYQREFHTTTYCSAHFSMEDLSLWDDQKSDVDSVDLKDVDKLVKDISKRWNIKVKLR